MLLNNEDGANENIYQSFSNQKELANHLNSLSTFSRFLRFTEDFRKEENDQISYSLKSIEGKTYILLQLKDAAEYMLTKDYTDNWNSEMHERFCFWSIKEWKEQLEAVGFELSNNSIAYTNPWIANNRFDNKVKLFDEQMQELPYPPTNALMIAKKL
ncbi:hypothetical protein QYS49_02220 [Marivirga salinae]|uniref:Uncharacterized protein n=1 Tax=Marivirga salinarum TaxID=3059078 RepID=A0AA49GDV2_9BACT|nr:hypothetical protein [Marivirga sp. BDSF4-3]WKK76227.1 hypothetical protein QYS49_02220 [Marivirga sp. BDSF4-3]